MSAFDNSCSGFNDLSLPDVSLTLPPPIQHETDINKSSSILVPDSADQSMVSPQKSNIAPNQCIPETDEEDEINDSDIIGPTQPPNYQSALYAHRQNKVISSNEESGTSNTEVEESDNEIDASIIDTSNTEPHIPSVKKKSEYSSGIKNTSQKITAQSNIRGSPFKVLSSTPTSALSASGAVSNNSWFTDRESHGISMKFETNNQNPKYNTQDNDSVNKGNTSVDTSISNQSVRDVSHNQSAEYSSKRNESSFINDSEEEADIRESSIDDSDQDKDYSDAVSERTGMHAADDSIILASASRTGRRNVIDSDTDDEVPTGPKTCIGGESFIDIASSDGEDSCYVDAHINSSFTKGASVSTNLEKVLFNKSSGEDMVVESSHQDVSFSKYSTEQLETQLRHKQSISNREGSSLFKETKSVIECQIDLLKNELASRATEKKVDESVAEISTSSSSAESEDEPVTIETMDFVKKPVYRYEPPPSPVKEEEVQIISPEERDPISQLEELIKIKSNIYRSSNLRGLVDGGEEMLKEINSLERELMMAKFKTKTSNQGTAYKQAPLEEIKLNLGASSSGEDKRPEYVKPQMPQHVIDALFAADKNYGARDYGGKLSHAREREMVRVTSNVLESFENVIKNMPDAETIDPDSVDEPSGLRVTLMPHQKRALKWMLWRETQDPPGGILADDMGLGKTLSMLSLISRHNELVNGGLLEDFAQAGISDEESKLEEQENNPHGWLARSGYKKLKKSQGTLIVCPASLIGQWEGEVNRRFYSHKLRAFIYHGTNRDTSVRRLQEHDIVITTYQLAMKEAFGKGGCKVKEKNSDGIPMVFRKDQGSLYQIGWSRIILDEAHIIRNHKSQTAQAMCMLKGARRWAVTGTPVQNKEMDMFSLIRFLRVSPFDDYTCWKHQIQNGSAQGRRRLGMVVKAIMLRRTKDQVDAVTGKALVTLPPKIVVEHKFSLKQEEREIYDRVFAYSKNSLVDYMKTHEQKMMDKEMKTGKGPVVSSVDEQSFMPTLNMQSSVNSEVKTHHLLVLLLRLRQVCCHPCLIKSIVDEAEQAAEGIETTVNTDEDDLVSQLNNMTVKDMSEIDQETSETMAKNKVFTLSNPVFDPSQMSSKIEKVVHELAKIKQKGKTNKEGEPDPNGHREKAVIVSQWTSMLNIVHQHLMDCGLKSLIIDGKVPVKDRTAIVDDFNTNPKGSKVLLLSLAAGGVGLNLIGANHLFLLDMHWNPQMEKQACDRVYRVGQTRPVTIHRFIVENTVEVKIVELQEKKLQLADEVLSGAKRTAGNKLTLDDLKQLFNVA